MSLGTDADIRRPAAVSRRLVLLFAVATGVAVANNYYAQPLLAAIRADLHVGSGVAGSVVTVAQAGYALGLVFLLPLGDMLERRRLVAGMSVVAAGGLLLACLAPGVPLLLLAFLWVGAASVVAQVLVPFAASLADEHERGRVVGTVMSGLLLGILLARTVAGYLAEATDWRVVYAVAAAAMVALAAALYAWLPDAPQPEHAGYRALLVSTVRLVRAEPVLRLRAAYGALSFGCFSVLWTTLAFLLSGPPYHYQEGTIGLFGLVGAAGAAAASVAGRLADRGWTRRTTGGAAAALALSWLAIWLGASSLAWLLAGIVLLDLAAQGLHITNQSEIYRLAPDARSRINAVYMVSYFVGGAAGSAGGASLYAAAGWDGVSAYGAAFGVAAVVLWLLRRGR